MYPSDCPFLRARQEIQRLRVQTNVIVVDFHAEATSEKRALGWYLDGSASAVLGTHTHVQTADDEILPGSTAYISDIIEKFLTQIPNRFEVAKNDIRLQGVVLEIDAASGKANDVERISVKLNQ